MEEDPPIPSEDRLRGLLKVLEEEAPDLLERLVKVLYDPDVSQSIGKAVGNFYKELKESGMGDETACRITIMFASNLSVKHMMRGMGPMGRPMMGPMMGPPMGMRHHGPMYEGKG